MHHAFPVSYALYNNQLTDKSNRNSISHAKINGFSLFSSHLKYSTVQKQNTDATQYKHPQLRQLITHIHHALNYPLARPYPNIHT